MPSFEYIDSYFKGEFAPGEKKEFEDRITQDNIFAEDVAFYLSTLQAARNELADEKKKRFRKMYQSNVIVHKSPVRSLWQYAAAAAVIAAIIIGAYTYWQPTSSKQLAHTYINDHFATIRTTMGTSSQALPAGKRLYNDAKYPEALKKFELVIQQDSLNADAIKYAGIAALKMQDYSKALYYFSKLEKYTQMKANYGKFYHGLTLLTRNQPGDRETAKTLFNEVINEGLAGREDAVEFIKHL